MLRKWFFGFVLSCICLTFPAPGMTKDTITWMEAVFPPFLIHEGTFAGLGYGDIGTNIIIENLSQYDHHQVIANLSRQYKQFKQQEKVCTIGLYKTPEREQFMHFSIPAFFSLPTRLIITKKNFSKFGSKNRVNLTVILNSNKYIIGHSTHRSYGTKVDNVLRIDGNNRNMFLYESRSELAGNFFEMLLKNRVDAILGNPEEILYQAEKSGIRDRFMSLTIEENQTDLDSWFSYVACPKNPWGEKVIRDVNKVLVEQRPTEKYRGAYERWIDQNSLEVYRQSYDQIFLDLTQ